MLRTSRGQGARARCNGARRHVGKLERRSVAGLGLSRDATKDDPISGWNIEYRKAVLLTTYMRKLKWIPSNCRFGLGAAWRSSVYSEKRKKRNWNIA